MRKLMLLMAPIIPVLAGCAGSVIFGHVIGQDHPASPVQTAPQEATPAPMTAAPAAPAPAAPVAQQQQTALPLAIAKVRAATLEFTAEATDKIKSEPRFSRDALLASINAQLRSHNLIDDTGSNQADRSVEITIDEFAIRPSSNAVVFGYVFSDATLDGNAEVHDANGRELEHFEISAHTRLTTRTDDGQTLPLASLYRRFADVTVSKLTGVPFKAPESEMPR